MTHDKPAFVERRCAKRKMIRFSLRFKIIGKDGLPVIEATTKDISSANVAFVSSECIPIETKIEGSLCVPSIKAPIKFVGSIKRIEKMEGNKFLYAASFDQIKDEDRAALEKCVQVFDVDRILRLAISKDASDVHLVANQPPVVRILNELNPLENMMPIPAEELKKMLLSILTEKQKQAFEENLELDFTYLIPEGSSFRVNMHLVKGNLEAAFRIIPEEIRSISELNLPPVLGDLARKRKGLIIISGVAGSGKSTTLAAMIDLINSERKCMVISIEDPIEYIHKPRSSIIKQREVGSDTLSFANAIKHSLRQDPNVILIGEMRDLDSISMAITAAETGHLVLTTLHTKDTVEAIHRIVDVYPENQQSQVRSQLASSLEGVISQVLLPRKDGKGRIVATEVLIITEAVRNLIRNNKIEQIYSYIESGEKHGMHTMDKSLLGLIKDKLVGVEEAFPYSKDPNKLKSYLLA